MEEEIIRCRKAQLDFDRETEACFAIANQYWNRVRERLKIHHFKTDQNEIEFFKILKPKFTSQIEFYILLYHASLFQPPDAEAARNFWDKEYRRFENFVAENKSFVQCYQDSFCEMLPYYFLRRFYVPKSAFELKMYEADNRNVTNGDAIAANLLALKQFQLFAEKKLCIDNR